MAARNRLAGAWQAMYRAARPLRRFTILGPLLDALQLRAILRRIRDDWRIARVLGPDEFAPYLRALIPLSPFAAPPRDLSFDYVIVRQEHLNGLPGDLLATLLASFACTRVNVRFALFEPLSRGARESPGGREVVARLRALVSSAPGAVRALPSSYPSDCAILVTTFNRPRALARSLPAITSLGYRVLVVDDGSHGAAAEENERICRTHGATRLALPENRGLVPAMNIGLSYLFADRALAWISYFQDDVDVAPGAMTRIRSLEDLETRPLLTGYDADEHAADSETEINGIRIKLKRSSPAVHLHAHVTYWKGIWPLPSEYRGAPRRRWEASLEDYWIINHAPNSVGKRGIPVICVPNLVRTFLFSAADSTWGNPNQPDPPLAVSANQR